MKKILMFTLSMPNNNSWNGKWSGNRKIFAEFQTVSKGVAENLMKDEEKQDFYYDFGDGWGASVSVEIIDAETKRKMKKLSQGFCGYNWMIKEILEFGRIKTREERIAERESKA